MFSKIKTSVKPLQDQKSTHFFYVCILRLHAAHRLQYDYIHGIMCIVIIYDRVRDRNGILFCFPKKTKKIQWIARPLGNALLTSLMQKSLSKHSTLLLMDVRLMNAYSNFCTKKLFYNTIHICTKHHCVLLRCFATFKSCDRNAVRMLRHRQAASAYATTILLESTNPN